ncbi:MAG TPA: SpoIIE family protein phosphatase [Blastocatellia bacterium]|nr:SpoIIE family protein phosphatase [Blastocatellia bacterium]
MNKRVKIALGILLFALLLTNAAVGIRAGLAEKLFTSDCGLEAEREGGRYVISRISLHDYSPVLHPGDEIVGVKGLPGTALRSLVRGSLRLEPGSEYTLVVNCQGQLHDVPMRTMSRPLSEWLLTAGNLAIPPVFLLTALIVFLLRPDDRQALMLALMLGTFSGLINAPGFNGLSYPVSLLLAISYTLALWFLPLFFHFFLIFPERSPLLGRFPRLESRLYWPFLLLVFPPFAWTRIGFFFPAAVNDTFRPALNLIRWPGVPLVIGYLVCGLVSMFVNYRVADTAARRRLHVVVAGCGAGFLNVVLVVFLELSGLQRRYGPLYQWLQVATVFTLPLIPISFAYAIVRHRVIPVSLIIRRSVRYMLVSRGSGVLEMATIAVGIALVVSLISRFLKPGSETTIAIIAGVVAIAVRNLVDSFYRRVVAPAIDRRFFRESYDAQQILAELAQSVRTATGIGQLLELVTTRIQKALHAENVTVFLRDEASGEYASAVSSDYSANGHRAALSQDGLRLPESAYVIRRLAESPEPLVTDFRDPDSSLHERLTGGNGAAHHEHDVLERLNTALLLPLAARDHLLGLISLGPRLGDLPYSGEDEKLLMSVAGQTAFAIENTRLIERMIEDARRRQELEAENEQRARELEEARQLQLSMLPRSVPQLPHLDIAAYMKTAAEVGGDYYDFHLADDRRLTIAVGDATGHGLKAGTVVTATKGLFNELACEPDLTEIFRRSSRALRRMNLRGLYMAMALLRVEDHRLTVSAAGMPAILIHRARGGAVEEILLRGMPLGSVRDYEWRQQTVELLPGDVVMAMSDGFTERFNERREMYDEERARALLAEVAGQSPQEIISHFVRAGEEWAGCRPQDDDVTFVVLKVKGGDDIETNGGRRSSQ